MINRKTICRVANKLAKKMSRSEAFKKAWALAKKEVVEKVAGVTKGLRQRAIERLANYPVEQISFSLERETDNEHDPSAIRVIASVKNKGSFCMGYLAAKTAALLAPLMDEGICINSSLREIVGGELTGIRYFHGLRITTAI